MEMEMKKRQKEKTKKEKGPENQANVQITNCQILMWRQNPHTEKIHN